MTGQSKKQPRAWSRSSAELKSKNGGMLISQPVNSCLTNHSELCMSCPRNNQSHRISIYRLQRRPSFGFESSVSSTSMTSGDPVILIVPCCLFRSGFSSKPAADDAHAGVADPDASAVDRVVTSAGLGTVSAPAHDDVKPA